LINPGAEFNATTGFMLAHEVMPDKTEAKYESGLLRIFAPMKDWGHKVNVMVQ
jgi:HSP20 family molecular chaperone IbpA